MRSVKYTTTRSMAPRIARSRTAASTRRIGGAPSTCPADGVGAGASPAPTGSESSGSGRSSGRSVGPDDARVRGSKARRVRRSAAHGQRASRRRAAVDSGGSAARPGRRQRAADRGLAESHRATRSRFWRTLSRSAGRLAEARPARPPATSPPAAGLVATLRMSSSFNAPSVSSACKLNSGAGAGGAACPKSYPQLRQRSRGLKADVAAGRALHRTGLTVSADARIGRREQRTLDVGQHAVGFGADSRRPAGSSPSSRTASPACPVSNSDRARLSVTSLARTDRQRVHADGSGRLGRPPGPRPLCQLAERRPRTRSQQRRRLAATLSQTTPPSRRRRGAAGHSEAPPRPRPPPAAEHRRAGWRPRANRAGRR